MSKRDKPGLNPLDMLLLWLALALWLAVFLIGTLVSSAPYRSSFAAFEGGFMGTAKAGLKVVVTYTLTNVAILCILAGVLGALGSRAVLGTDIPGPRDPSRDTISPRHSAVLRSFLVYLALIAGVLIVGDNPAEPTQIMYVKVAGLMSLAGFVVSYRPRVFGRLIERTASLFAESGRD